MCDFGLFVTYKVIFFNKRMTDANNGGNKRDQKVRVWVDGW